MTVYLNAAHYSTGKELHLALQRLLNLPEHYGCNADALYDCLSERKEQPEIRLMGKASGEAADALKKCLCVFEDVGAEVIRL